MSSAPRPRRLTQSARFPLSVSPRARSRRRNARIQPVFQLEPIERRLLLASVAGTFFQDLNADGVRDPGEAGLAGWTVFLDENQNGTFDGSSQTLPSSDVPQTVPDPGTVFSNLDVTGVGSIAKVTVKVSVTTLWAADIDMWLISPLGTRIELSTDNGGSGDHYIDTIFDDDAPTSITTGTAPFTGTYRPEQPLAGFIGQNADGQWRLEVADDLSGFPGTLESWSLTFSSGERSTTSSATGGYTFVNVGAGTYDVRQVSQAGWNQTAPAGGFHTVTLDASTNATGLDFGNRQPPGTIRGNVFSDYNANGTRDAGEPGLSGWTVYLDNNDNSVIDAGEVTTTSDGNGNYEFINLAPQQYFVRVIMQSGYVQTVPGSGGVVLDGAPGNENGNGAGNGTGGGNDNGRRSFSQTEIVVAFKGTIGKGALKKEVQAQRAIADAVDYGRSTDMFTVQGVTLVEVKLRPGVDPERAVALFEQRGKVKWAQVNYTYDDIDPREFTPNDPQYGSQYHHPLMKNNLAWDTTLGSPDILIGITDDGFLMNHPDLVDNYWINPGEIPGNGIDDDGNGFIDDVSGWDFWTNDNDPNPGSASNDHGTHVAGIAAARTHNAVGVAGTAGGSSIVPIRFYSTSGGSWTSTIVSNAYRYATDVGCQILTTSYNVDGFANDNIFAAAVNYMYDGGVLHFNSAGNTSAANPARQKFDTTLYVVNTQANDTKSSSSAWGWGVDVSAPGTNILSTSIGSNLSTPNYESKSGTSMASPNAAGVAALIWSANPTWTREQVAAQLLGSADNIDAQNPSFAGLLGAGRVNSFRALNETIAAPRIKTLAGLPVDGGSTLTKPANFTLDVASVFDHATMNPTAFEMRGAGFDGEFGTPDDTLIPLTVVFGGTNSPTYRIGTNRVFISIPGSMGSDTYRFSLKATATDPFGQALDGNGDGTGGDAFTRTFVLAGPTNSYQVTLDPGEVQEGVDFGNHDRVPPRVLTSSFAYATAPHRIVVQFSEDVSGALAIGDMTLENLTTSQTVDTSGFALNWDAGTNTATINTAGVLADGNYRATFAAAGITDPSGNALDGDEDGTAGGDYAMQFFFLMGDANHDGRVNLDDFNILAANFGQSPRDFTQADFTYDGMVNLDDFNILASSFGNVLGGGTSASAGETPEAPTSPVKGLASGATTRGDSLTTRGGSLTTRGAGSIGTTTESTATFSRTRIGVLQEPGDRDEGHTVLLDEQTGRLSLA